ncbi:hypothetical protein MMC29_005217, partial [Sticta canariensis]|nr:hypothetical protein [Sticta canariensis]
MNQAPSGAQAPYGAQLPDEVQLPPEALALIDPLGQSDRRTPLGGPMNQLSAFLRAQNPLDWLRQYWLNIGVVGMLRGEDRDLLVLRIEIEHTKIPDPDFRAEFRNSWRQYRVDNRDEIKRQWVERTLESREARPYHRDIDRMLVNKGPKTRNYLRQMERLMITSLRDQRVGTARVFFNQLSQLYGKLRDEERADADARVGLPNDFEEGRSLEDIEADGDEEAAYNAGDELEGDEE